MKKLFFLVAIILGSLSAFAGNDGRGGGDICEDRIKIIRDDIKAWIMSGGSQYLKLPANMTIDQYNSGMLEEISIAKIRCVRKGDLGFPVEYLGVSKTCVFNSNNHEITCDFDKFNNTSDSNQYVLTHHEYAGLANIESPNGSDSNYEISNQISGYLANQVVRRLVVRPNYQLPENILDAKFIKISAGTFQMGSPTSEKGRNYLDDNETLHTVQLDYDFEIQSTMVSHKQWIDQELWAYKEQQEKYMNIGGFATDNVVDCVDSFDQSFSFCPSNPLYNASWKEAAFFANQTSIRMGLEVCYKFDYPKFAPIADKNLIFRGYTHDKIEDCKGYRLPTEAEWEYATRGLTQAQWDRIIKSQKTNHPVYATSYFFGGDVNQIDDYAWSGGIKDFLGYHAHPLATKKPNSFGLYDVYGDAFQWVNDTYSKNYGLSNVDTNEVAINPTGGVVSNPVHVLRGSSWMQLPLTNTSFDGKPLSKPIEYMRSAARCSPDKILETKTISRDGFGDYQYLRSTIECGQNQWVLSDQIGFRLVRTIQK